MEPLGAFKCDYLVNCLQQMYLSRGPVRSRSIYFPVCVWIMAALRFRAADFQYLFSSLTLFNSSIHTGEKRSGVEWSSVCLRDTLTH